MAKVQFIAMHQFMANMVEPIAVEMRKRGHDVYENYKEGSFEGCKNSKFRDNYDATVISYHHYLRPEFDIRKYRPIFFIEHCVTPVKSAYGTPFCEDNKTWVEEKTDYVFIQGQMFKEWFNLNCPTHKGALLTGWPRIETLLNMRDMKQDIIKRHNLNPNEPIILYVPTWDSKAGSSGKPGTMRQGWPVLASLNLPNLLCLAHPSDYYSRYISSKEKRVVLGKDTYEYIKAADLIIGDISSVLIESTVLDKPIIQLNQFNDLRNFQLWPSWTDKAKTKHLDSLMGIYQLGEIVSIEKQRIKYAIEDALNDPNKYQMHRKYWKEKAFYNLGSSTKACADAMEKILGKK